MKKSQDLYFESAFPFYVLGSAQARASCQSNRTVKSHHILRIPQHFLMKALPPKQWWFAGKKEQWPFGIKRKFSASTFLVLESLLLSPIGPWCVNNLRLSSICVFNHKLVPKIIWRYNFPQPFIFSNWPLTVFLLRIASVVLRLGTWT